MGKTNDYADHYEGALLEEIRDNVQQLAESMSDLANKMDRVDNRLSAVEANTVRIPSIKTALVLSFVLAE